MNLSNKQIETYSRQILLPEVGGKGQEKLLAASVAFLEKNQITEFAALCLAGAGVGKLVFPEGEKDKNCGLASLLLDRNPDVQLLEAPIQTIQEMPLLITYKENSADLDLRIFDAEQVLINLDGTAEGLAICLIKSTFSASIKMKPLGALEADIILQAGTQLALYTIKTILNPGDTSLDKVLLINKTTGELRVMD